MTIPANNFMQATPVLAILFALSQCPECLTKTVRPHSMFYFKRQWDESHGDKHDDWGASTWYFETEADMWPTRQVEVYAAGKVLQYDRQHVGDAFGGLSEVALDAAEFGPFAITRAEFEQVWSSHEPMNR